jgi:hypothetical protein
MPRFERKYVVWLLAGALVAFLAWYFLSPRGMPLISLTQNNSDQFGRTFDAAANESRLVLLLSPT